MSHGISRKFEEWILQWGIQDFPKGINFLRGYLRFKINLYAKMKELWPFGRGAHRLLPLGSANTLVSLSSLFRRQDVIRQYIGLSSSLFRRQDVKNYPPPPSPNYFYWLKDDFFCVSSFVILIEGSNFPDFYGGWGSGTWRPLIIFSRISFFC